MEVGETVASLPDTLLTHEYLDTLTESNGIDEAIPVISSTTDSGETLITRQFIMRLNTIGYILAYDEERGWVVQEARSEDEVPKIPEEYETAEELPHDELCKGLLFRSQMDGIDIPDEPTDDTGETEETSAIDSTDTGSDTGAELQSRVDGGTSASLVEPTGDPELDPTAPTDANRDLLCTHCENTVSETDVEYIDRFDESRWWCPTTDCSGAGVGVDLHPV